LSTVSNCLLPFYTLRRRNTWRQVPFMDNFSYSHSLKAIIGRVRCLLCSFVIIKISSYDLYKYLHYVSCVPGLILQSMRRVSTFNEQQPHFLHANTTNIKIKVKQKKKSEKKWQHPQGTWGDVSVVVVNVAMDVAVAVVRTQANNSILNRNDRNLINTRICFARLLRSSDHPIPILDSRSRSTCGYSRDMGMQLSLGMAITKHFVCGKNKFHLVRSQFLSSCVCVCVCLLENWK